MEVLIICALVTICLGLDLDFEWESYKEQYNKVYTDGREEQVRKSIFVQKIVKHIKHNEHYAAGRVSYTVGVNKFTDWTEEELRRLMPPMVLHKKRRSGVPRFEYNSSVEVPDSFDWREKGAVTPVKDQGSCGSCYAFSSTGALEAAHYIKTKQLVEISEQNLIDCSKGYGNNGCGGGNMENCFEYVKENEGIDTESAYPYDDAFKTCRYNSKSIATTVSDYKEVNSETALKQAVATIGPVSIGLAAQLLPEYTGGIIDKPCTSTKIDHALLVVGYGSEKGKDYWIIKNSWGADYGENGYFRMVRNKHLCGLGDYGTYPIV